MVCCHLPYLDLKHIPYLSAFHKMFVYIPKLIFCEIGCVFTQKMHKYTSFWAYHFLWKKVRIFLVFNINVTATLYFTGIPTARHLYHFFLKSGTQPEPSMVPFGKRTTFCTTFSKPARMVTRCQKTYYLWGLQEIFILYLIKCVPFSKKKWYAHNPHKHLVCGRSYLLYHFF